MLTEQGSAWFYKPNRGDGRFGAVETVAVRPSLADLSNSPQQLMDLAGDGNLDLVDLSGSAPGFYERTFDAGWKGFRAFRSLPVRDWSDANLRFVDLTGDGIADVLITEDDAFTWHPYCCRMVLVPGPACPWRCRKRQDRMSSSLTARNRSTSPTCPATGYRIFCAFATVKSVTDSSCEFSRETENCVKLVG